MAAALIVPSNRNGNTSASALDLPEPFGPRRIMRPSAKEKTCSSYSQMFLIPARLGFQRTTGL